MNLRQAKVKVLRALAATLCSDRKHNGASYLLDNDAGEPLSSKDAERMLKAAEEIELDLDAEHGGPSVTAQTCVSRAEAEAFMNQYVWICFNGGMAKRLEVTT